MVDPQTLVENAVFYYQEFSDVQRQNKLLSIAPHHAPLQSPQWSFPPNDFVKVNVDAPFSSSSKLCGGGYVARNHEGRVLSLGSWLFQDIFSPVVAEGLSLRAVIQVCLQWGWPKIIFEGDCQTIIKLCSSEEALATIVHDIKVLLQHGEDFSLNWVLRHCNRVAHEICRWSFLSNFFEPVWSLVPASVGEALLGDLC
ncbi:uncharacterized protein LOC132266245 [Cornus florida]|uniref:uncharacterized protein LOC132266245 n=1 Tax=Cornus florida TaxID=4283 RepID=UPI002896E687|nr:uncharacterized protein LOC132266245 [Cornus florida]